MIHRLLASLAAVFALAACDKPDQTPKPSPTTSVETSPSPADTAQARPDTSNPNIRGDFAAPDTAAAPLVRTAGTIRYVEVEGGGWVIDTPDGTFQPLNLDAAYRVNGQRVTVTLRPHYDMASTLQVGLIADIVHIAKR